MTVRDRQYWVRNEQGRTWGPYDLDALERLRGMISDKWEVSLDGREFHGIADFPELAELAAAPKRPAPPPIPKPQGEDREERDAREAARRAARASIEHSRVRSPSPSPSRLATPAAGSPMLGTPTIWTPTHSPSAAVEPTLPEEGELEHVSPLRLYALAALTSASGWLQLESAPGTMLQISFRRGTPEHLESDDPELSLLSFLRKRGTVTGPQALEAVAHTEKTGVDLVTALFQLQLIPPADAHRLLNEQMLSLLDRALMTWRGRFSFERDAPPPPGAFPLGQRWTLLAESIRRLDAGTLQARLGARLLAPVLRSGGLALGRIEELALTAHEARLYAAIDGVRTGEELLRDSQDPAATLRLLYLLTELGHLAFSGNHLAEGVRQTSAGTPPARPAPVAPPPPPAEESAPASHAIVTPPPAPPVARPSTPAVPQRTPTAPSMPAVARTPSNPTLSAARTGSTSPSMHAVRVGTAAGSRSPASSAAQRAPAPPAAAPPSTFVSGPPNETPAGMHSRLAAILARIEPADHFTALGLERKTTAVEVKKAFFQLARELHPDTVQDGNVELRDLKQRLFARVNEAAQVLGDEKRRKEHEDELDGKGNVDVARIFAAEEAFLRGEIMIKARKLAEGVALIDEAISLNADEGEFYAWRGWARFVLSKDRKSQYPLSAADCKKALAMIERCLPAWLFLGNMAKAMGDIGEAERSFRKVLELDPKHVEAQRELRTMGRKLEPK